VPAVSRVVVVERVAAMDTLALRQQVLRPGRPLDESIFPGDDDPRTAHVAARVRLEAPELLAHVDEGIVFEGILAVGTVLPEPPPWDAQRPDGWRVRGMATRPELRGRGLGGRVLAALLDHVAAGGGGVVWCNARITAVAFYERAGFQRLGTPFDLPTIGVHQRMWRLVEADVGPDDRRSEA